MVGQRKQNYTKNEREETKKTNRDEKENEVHEPPPSERPIPNPSIPRAGLLPAANDKMHADEEETEGEVEGSPFGKLPDHLLLEIFVRLPVPQWVHISCASKQWATLFRRDCLWQAALLRRCMALYISRNSFSLRGDMDEIIGHTYLFLKEQLELSSMTPSGIIQGTMIGHHSLILDMAHELASQIWITVLDNLEENEHAFLLLKRLAQEPDVFLPYPYSRSMEGVREAVHRLS